MADTKISALTDVGNIAVTDDLVIVRSGTNAKGQLPSASATLAGLIEIASNAEATAASATDKALVPSNLSSIAVSTFSGFIDWTSASSAFSTSGTAATGALTVTGNISVTGTVDGRDVATDGTKLDGIEALADVTDATNVAAAGAVMDTDFSTNGVMVRTASGTYTNRTITGTANAITISNGDGVSGDPTIDISDNPTIGGTDSIILPLGTTAQRNGTPTEGMLRGNTTTNNIEYYDGTTWVDLTAGAGGGITALVDDTTPQLGGMLDVNGQSIGDGTLELLKFTETASAVNEITITNAATTGSPSITATGDDTNVGLLIDTKGTGTLALGSADSVVTMDGTSISGTLIKDEDNMASNSATHLATQQSIKAYADTKLANVVEDTTPQLGGDLDLNGNQITSPDGTDLIDIPNGSIDLQTASTSRLDITDSGVRLGAANARVTTILDEDTMTSDSATALATQQSIKAYADGLHDWVFLGASTASSSANIDFTNLTGYAAYRVIIRDYHPATDATSLVLRFSSDNGSTLISSGYRYQILTDVSTTIASLFSSSQSEILLLGDIDNGTTNDGMADITICLSDGGFYSSIIGTASAVNSANTSLRKSQVMGQYVATTAIDAIRFLSSSGNITAGDFYIYGLVAS